MLLSLTFNCKPVCENGGKTTIAGSRQYQKPVSIKKHKTPSRRKRDRLRFHTFLDKKKQLEKQQISKTVPQNSNSSSTSQPQCPPPPDKSVTVSPRIETPFTQPVILTTSPPPELPPRSSDDSWITVSDDTLTTVCDDTPLDSSTQRSATPVVFSEPDEPAAEPIPVYPQPPASIQPPYPFKTVQERFAELYTNCGHCQLPSAECTAGLKGTSGGTRHCIWTPDCPLKLSCYPALDPTKRIHIVKHRYMLIF